LEGIHLRTSLFHHIMTHQLR